jgi:hypothetical protein
MPAGASLRKLSTLILTLWVISSGAIALHTHHSCCWRGHEHGHEHEQQKDEAPESCSICEAVHHVPLTALVRAEKLEAKRVVILWISPWIAMIPEEVFFDRPLARGPPAVP